jgi:hypothetical protein
MYREWHSTPSVLGLTLTHSTVNLTILKYSHNSVLPEIAQNLSLLPNLHSLQLIFRFYCLQEVFSQFQYSSIHTLNLNWQSPYGDILRACQNTRYFSFYKDVGIWPGNWTFDERGDSIEKLGVMTHISRTSGYSIFSASLCNTLQNFPNSSLVFVISP